MNHASAPRIPPKPDAFRFSENNFDLVRLVAASEVAIRHSIHHLAPKYQDSPLFWFLDLIPGVPVFFFLSGYLISRSWERAPNLREFSRNRALRLFPALWTCTALSVAVLFASGYLATVQWKPSALAAWVLCQGTVVQFWNPEFLRGFGVGVVNGSLWSVSVEIQFYVATAVMYLALRRLRGASFDAAILCLIAVFAPLNAYKDEICAALGDGTVSRLYRVTFVPWFYMFLLGVLAQRWSGILVPALRGRWIAVVALYVAVVVVDHHILGGPAGNEIAAYAVPVMGAAVLALAYSAPTLSRRILGHDDWSYGVYIYHMPVVNLILWCALDGSVVSVVGALVVAAALAGLSWRFVEQPLLRRKRAALRPAAA